MFEKCHLILHGLLTGLEIENGLEITTQAYPEVHITFLTDFI